MDNLTRPDPDTAYAQWTGACARAGWPPWGDRPDTERVSLADGLGRVTARPVTARWPSPREDRAAMDGIAVNSGTVNSGAAGDERSASQTGNYPNVTNRRLTSGFTWIDTGDPLPPGTDTVIKREQVTIDDDGSAVIDPSACLTPGKHVRKRGEDFAEGQVLVPEGRRLRPADLAVAASAGHAVLAVARRPDVVIIPTGDEIRPVAGIPGSGPESGEIIDSNSVWLTTRCAQAGARSTVTDIVPDDPDLLAAAIRQAATEADLVLVIAGSSRGRDDYTSSVLAQVGGLTVTGVAVRPGHPAILGHAKSPVTGTVPVIGLPGYPIATAVTFELFALPLLKTIQGDRAQPQTVPATLTTEWTSCPDKEEWVPVTLSQNKETTEATPVGHGASSTSNLATATAWWRIPANESRFAPGTRINVRLWD